MAETVYEKVVIQAEGIRLSQLVWRRFQRPMIGMVEHILDRQGELSRSSTLQVGAVVEIPIDPEPMRPSATAITLWD